LLLRSVFAMNVAMPAVVSAVVVLFGLHPAVKVALIALAVSPVPPFLPSQAVKLVTPARANYVYGLLVATSLLSIVIVPLTVAALAAGLGREAHIDPGAVARIVALTVLVPLGIGLALRHWIPAAEKLASPANALGTILLVLALVVLLAKTWPSMVVLIGNGTLAAIIAIAAIGLTVGHLLGGPVEDDRTVLALATATRHPAVALAVAAFANQPLAPAAIVLALVVGGLATLPYTAWRKRLHANRTPLHPDAGPR
jgi:BASS family bile acid:Na+ symporter